MSEQADWRSSGRRFELTGAARWQVAAIGAAAGAGLAALGLRPTGTVPVDVALLVAACAFGTWCGCTAPWWLLVVSGAISVSVNPFGIGTALGLAAIAGATWVGLQQQSKLLLRAGVVALLMVSMGFVENLYRFGFSTLLGVLMVAALAIGGLARRPRADRKLARRIMGGIAVVAFVGTALFGIAAYRSLGALRDANQGSRNGLAAMRSADFDTASEQFLVAARSFDDANRSLSAPWIQPVRLVPVVAQQWEAAHLVTSASAYASFEIATNADRVDVDRLQFVDGRVDIDAIRSLREPLGDVQEAIDGLDTAVTDAQSPWLAPQLADRLDALGADIEEQQRLGDNAVMALDVAPALLGADGERRYFVMFTTPAEARGQGGFMGSYAEIVANNGEIKVELVGRPTDLNQSLRDNQPVTLQDAPNDWMVAWGSFGFRKPPDDRVSDQAWSIITVGADFPNNAQVVAELYPESGGTEIDGVFSLDVYALEALVGLVGPVQVPNGPTLDGTNTANYLLVGQYRNLPDDEIAEANAERIDALGVIAEEVTTRLLSTSPPDPLALGRALAPFANEHRMLGWSATPEEQALFEEIDIDGRVLDVDDVTMDGVEHAAVKVVANNSGASKIDSFLEVEATAAGDEVTVNLTNTAPSSGLPRYIIGSVDADQPLGTSKLTVSLYTTDEIAQLAIDGEPRSTATQVEAGRFLNTFRVDLAAGESATITFEIDDDRLGGDPLIVNNPPPGRRPQG